MDVSVNPVLESVRPFFQGLPTNPPGSGGQPGSPSVQGQGVPNHPAAAAPLQPVHHVHTPSSSPSVLSYWPHSRPKDPQTPQHHVYNGTKLTEPHQPSIHHNLPPIAQLSAYQHSRTATATTQRPSATATSTPGAAQPHFRAPDFPQANHPSIFSPNSTSNQSHRSSSSSSSYPMLPPGSPSPHHYGYPASPHHQQMQPPSRPPSTQHPSHHAVSPVIQQPTHSPSHAQVEQQYNRHAQHQQLLQQAYHHAQQQQQQQQQQHVPSSQSHQQKPSSMQQHSPQQPAVSRHSHIQHASSYQALQHQQNQQLQQHHQQQQKTQQPQPQARHVQQSQMLTQQQHQFQQQAAMYNQSIQQSSSGSSTSSSSGRHQSGGESRSQQSDVERLAEMQQLLREKQRELAAVQAQRQAYYAATASSSSSSRPTSQSVTTVEASRQQTTTTTQVLSGGVKRESPLDLSVKTVRQSADSTAKDDSEAIHFSQEAYLRAKFPGKSASPRNSAVPSLQLPSTVIYPHFENSASNHGANTFTGGAGAPKVDFLPNFAHHERLSTSNSGNFQEPNKSQRKNTSSQLPSSSPYPPHLSSLPNMNSFKKSSLPSAAYVDPNKQSQYYPATGPPNFQRSTSISNPLTVNAQSNYAVASTGQYMYDPSKRGSSGRYDYSERQSSLSFSKPPSSAESNYSLGKRQSSSELRHPLPPKIPKVDTWRQAIDQQIEQRLNSYASQRAHQVNGNKETTLNQTYHQSSISSFSTTPSSTIQTLHTSTSIPSNSSSISSNSHLPCLPKSHEMTRISSSKQNFGPQYYPHSQPQYSPHSMARLSHETNNNMSQVKNPSLPSNGAADKRVLSILRKRLDTREASNQLMQQQQSQLQAAQHFQERAEMYSTHTSRYYPQPMITPSPVMASQAKLQPQPTPITRHNLPPFNALGLDRNNPMSYGGQKLHLPKAVDSVVPEYSQGLPSSRPLSPSHTEVLGKPPGENGSDFDGLAAFLAARIRTKAELKQVGPSVDQGRLATPAGSGSNSSAHSPRTTPGIFSPPPSSQINYPAVPSDFSKGLLTPESDRASSSGYSSPMKSNRDRYTINSPRRRLFNEMGLGGESVIQAREAGLRSSSETSVFDFRESDSDGETGPERQSLTAMRRDRDRRIQEKHQALDPTTDLVKLDDSEPIEDSFWGGMCDQFVGQLQKGGIKVRKRGRRKKWKYIPIELIDEEDLYEPEVKVEKETDIVSTNETIPNRSQVITSNDVISFNTIKVESSIVPKSDIKIEKDISEIDVKTETLNQAESQIEKVKEPFIKEEPITEEPLTTKPSTEEPVTEESPSKEPLTQEPATLKLLPKRPPSNELLIKERPTGEALSKELSTKQLFIKKPMVLVKEIKIEEESDEDTPLSVRQTELKKNKEVNSKTENSVSVIKDPAENYLESAKSKIKFKTENIQKIIKEEANEDMTDSDNESSEDENVESVAKRLRARKPNDKPSEKKRKTRTCEKENSVTPQKSGKKKKDERKKSIFGDGSEFKPGWEAEVYRYKRSLRMPPGLINIAGPQNWPRLSTSLPDLDPDSPMTLDSEISQQSKVDTDCDSTPTKVKTKASPKSKIQKKGEEDSFLNRLIQRYGGKGKKALRKTSGKDESKEKKGPKIIPQTNELQLLPTPSLDAIVKRLDQTADLVKGKSSKGKKSNKEPINCESQESIFLGYFRKNTVANFRNTFAKHNGGIATEHELPPIMLKSRTRTQTRILTQRATIREVFGDDRPASAPPAGCRDEDSEEKDKSEDSATKTKKTPKNCKKLLNRRSSGNGISTRSGLRSAAVLRSHKAVLKSRQQLLHGGERRKRDKDLIKSFKTTKKQIKETEPKDDEIKPKSEPLVESEPKEGLRKDDVFLVPTVISEKRLKIRSVRRKLKSSGFDYIRKKKKQQQKKEGDSEAVKEKKKASPVKPVLESEEDIQNEIKTWVINKGLGETVLHRAARLGYTDIAAYCLEKMDHNPSPRDNAGYTPLHEACSKSRLDIAKLLLQYGADVSDSAQGGIRPLHEATEHGNLEMMRLLLSYGADPLLATYSGLTPLSLAHSPEARALLQAHLADVQGQPTSPWHVQLTDSDSLVGNEVLADAPSLDQEDGEEVEMEAGELSLPHLYQLRGEPLVDRWVLFQELGPVLRVKTREQLIKQLGPSHRNDFRDLKMTEFYDMARCCSVLGVGDRTLNPKAHKVTLVKYSDAVKQLLNSETTVFSAR